MCRACSPLPIHMQPLTPHAVCACQVVAAPPGELTMSDVMMWNGNKRLQTQVLPLTDDTISIRSLDWDRDRFDIEFG